MKGKLFGLLFFIVLLPIGVLGQVMEFDKLEMHYHQGHYKMVYRKANQLIDKPEYDYSYLPRYYRSISMLQLAQSERWLKRHHYAINEAEQFLLELQKIQEGKALLKAHKYEVSSLKSDLRQWASDLKIQKKTTQFKRVTELIETVFENTPYVAELAEDVIEPNTSEIEVLEENKSTTLADQRNLLISEAQKHIGTPYKWGGNSPDGFDCSGFTSYVLKNTLAIELDRRATDQYNNAKKIKRKNVQPGDLVFFDNGSGVSHVGIVISTKNDQIEMIHSSTSIGISIVNIDTSNYWKGRITGFGTYFS